MVALGLCGPDRRGIGPAPIDCSGPIGPLIFVAAFILAWNYLLLRALRWLWVGTIVVLACFTVIDLLTGTSTWYGNVLGLVELGLLLAPSTRWFFRAANPPLALEGEQ